MDVIVVILRWASQGLIVVVGTWGMFTDPYETDRTSGSRRLTRAGWVKVSLLGIGFLLFAITDMNERKQSLIARERQTEALRNQTRQANYLREVLLALHELSEVEITLAFLPGTRDRFSNSIRQFDRRTAGQPALDRTRLAYMSSAVQHGTTVVRYGGGGTRRVDFTLNRPQGLISDKVGDRDPEWSALETGLHDMFGGRFEIIGNTGRILLDILDPDVPIAARFDRDSLVITLRASGIRLDEVQGTVTFLCGRDKVLYAVQDGLQVAKPMDFGPQTVRFVSRDPRVSWDQSFSCDWKPVVTGTEFDEDSEPTAKKGEWRSGPQVILATFSGLEPN